MMFYMRFVKIVEGNVVCYGLRRYLGFRCRRKVSLPLIRKVKGM